MLSKSIFQFLTELEQNNNREWFSANKPRYQAAHEEVKAFANVLLDKMSHFDQIEKMRVHRIYRDVRFSKDKIPYKNSFSGGMSRATKYLRGSYYFHLEPGNSFVGGGFWGPNPEDLKRIRTDLAASPDQLRQILQDPIFVKTFGELKGEQLKTAPKGFDKEHPAIELLRYKQFLISHSFSDKEVFSKEFSTTVADTFGRMRPFLDYMSEVLTTDENGVPI